MKKIKTYAQHVIALFISAVFFDSLRFKFTNAPETQTIFGKLDAWAGTFGLEGIFSHTGLFSQYVLGAAELVAVVFLILGIFSAFRRFQVIGAKIAVAVMTGALYFHLFTPLGIDPNNDGGGLFVVAVLVWLGSIALLFIRKDDLKALYRAKKNFLFPNK